MVLAVQPDAGAGMDQLENMVKEDIEDIEGIVVPRVNKELLVQLVHRVPKVPLDVGVPLGHTDQMEVLVLRVLLVLPEDKESLVQLGNQVLNVFFIILHQIKLLIIKII